MKKIEKKILIALTIVLSFFFIHKSIEKVYAEEKAIYIASTGNDETGDGSETNPYLTLNKAIEVCDQEQVIIPLSNTVTTSSDYISSTNKILLSGDFLFSNPITIEGVTITVPTGASLSLSGPVTISTKSSIMVEENASFTINEGVNIVGGGVRTKGNFTMNAGEIRDSNTGVIVSSGGLFNMKDGKIFSNKRGVEVNRSSRFIMNGGNIVENTNDSCGAGVSMYTNSYFEMNGGIISNNIISNKYSHAVGAGVYIQGGTFVLNNGVIENNQCITSNAYNYLSHGGGVYLFPNNNAKFFMYGGDIKNNSAKAGGGLFVQTGAYAEIHGGSFTNNRAKNGGGRSFQGGAIYVNGGYDGLGYKDGVLKIYNPIIIENQSNKEGGGVASCPSGTLSLNMQSGAFIYNNTSTYDGTINKDDLYIDTTNTYNNGVAVHEPSGTFFISSHNYYSDYYNWKKISDNNLFELIGTEYELTESDGNIHIYSDKQYDSNQINLIEQNGVLIKGNVAENGFGGGIGSNGTIIIGSEDEIVSDVNISASCHECIVEQPEEINVTLYDKNDDKIKDLKLLKSENYSASITGLADLDGYYIEQESLGEDTVKTYVQKPVYTTTRADGKTVKNIDIEILNECKQEAAGTSAKLKKYLVMKENSLTPNTEFSFVISAGEGNDPATNSAVVYPGVSPSLVKVNGTAGSGTVTFAPEDETTSGPLDGIAESGEKYAMKDISLDFSAVKFSEPGVYRYILTEQSSSWNAITNDPEPVRVVDVHVVWNEDETEMIIGGYVGYYGNVTDSPKLIPEFTYEYQDTDGNGSISEEEKEAQAEAYSAAYSDFVASIQDGSGKAEGSYVNADEPIGVEAGDKSDKFVNKYNTQDLDFSKEVTGNMGSRDQYFEFTVTLNNVGNGTNIQIDQNSNFEKDTHENAYTTHAKSVMDSANSIDENQEITNQQLVADSSGNISKKFYLHSGQSVKLTGIPLGANYTITETESNRDGYTTSGEVTTSTTITSQDEVVNIVNRKAGVVPTGVMMSVAGGVGLLTLAGVGIMLTRKKEEE